MPLTKRTLSHTLAYASPSLYQSSPNDQVLKNTNMAAMSGSLTQLGFLASYATEMFQELFEVAEGLGKRVASVKERTERLVVDAKNMENEIALSHVNNNSAPDGATGQLNVEHSLICQLFVPDTLPAALKSRYDSADVINAPDFTEVDEAMTEEEKKKQNFLPCGQKFSNPGYFLDEWRKEEEARMAIAEEARRIKKAERKQRKQRMKEEREKERGVAKRVSAKRALNWRARFANDDINMGAVPSDQGVTSHRNLVEIGGMRVKSARMGAQEASAVKSAIRGIGAMAIDDGDSGGPGEPPMHPTDMQGSSVAAPPPPPGRKARPPAPPRADKTEDARENAPMAGRPFQPPPPPRRAKNEEPMLQNQTDRQGQPQQVEEEHYQEQYQGQYQEQYQEQHQPPQQEQQEQRQRPPPPARKEQPLPPAPRVVIPPFKDHPIYGKYFKMLKMGLPHGAVVNKAIQEDVPMDTINDVLSRDPEAETPAEYRDTGGQGPGAGEGERMGGMKGRRESSFLDGINQKEFSLKKAAPIVKRVDPKMNLLNSIKKGNTLKHVDVDEITKKRQETVDAQGGMFSGGGGAGINAILARRKFLAEESDESDTDSDEDDWS